MSGWVEDGNWFAMPGLFAAHGVYHSCSVRNFFAFFCFFPVCADVGFQLRNFLGSFKLISSAFVRRSSVKRANIARSGQSIPSGKGCPLLCQVRNFRTWLIPVDFFMFYCVPSLKVQFGSV